MAYTDHGYHIEGTSSSKFAPNIKVQCGGPEYCGLCSIQAVALVMAGSNIEPEILLGDNTANYQQRAAQLVREYVLKNYAHNNLGMFDVYVVWFCKTLQNWKALVATTMEDSRYYEVTYNGDKKETYLDAYTKIDNEVIPDS